MKRAKNNLQELQEFVREHDPDLVCIQEARLRASSSSRGRPKSSELDDGVDAALREAPLSNYRQIWSLADTRKAGSLVLIHNRLGKKGVDYNVRFTLRSAEALVASNCERGWGTSDCSKSTIDHDTDGRLVFLSFKSGLDLLATYVPSNGYKPESRARRSAFDASMLHFVTAHAAARAGCATPLNFIWLGDCNVAAGPLDSTDETFWRNEPPRDSSPVAPDPGDRGFPGIVCVRHIQNFDAIITF